MIFHVLSIPVHPTRKEITLCAFTQKVYKFCTEMTRRGHTVYHYGHPDSQVSCTEHINVVSRETYNKDYKKQAWQTLLSQEIDNETHREFNANAAKEILKRHKNPNEFVLAFWGFGHKTACEKVQDRLIVVEPSIGYDSIFAAHRVFESYAQLHKLLAASKLHHPSYTDHVIPPGFNPNDFEFSAQKEKYLLFLGRITDGKGVCIADELSRALRWPIKFVGPHNLKTSLRRDNPYAEYIPTVSTEERKHLLKNAKALIMPTLYVEPCGWAMMEAWFSGTPTLTTDWGGPSEYNLHRRTGFKCRTLNEFYHAATLIDTINPEYCRRYAESNFNIKDIMNQYESYFNLLIEEGEAPSAIRDKCTFAKPPFFV